MANKFTYQVLRDTQTDAVIKLTGTFDGTTNESNVSRIAANTLAGALATNGYLVANNQGGAANTTLKYYVQHRGASEGSYLTNIVLANTLTSGEPLALGCISSYAR